jgi:hypothetical protein
MGIKTDKEQEDHINSKNALFVCGNCQNWNNGKKADGMFNLNEHNKCNILKKKTSILDFCNKFAKAKRLDTKQQIY